MGRLTGRRFVCAVYAHDDTEEKSYKRKDAGEANVSVMERHDISCKQKSSRRLSIQP